MFIRTDCNNFTPEYYAQSHSVQQLHAATLALAIICRTVFTGLVTLSLCLAAPLAAPTLAAFPWPCFSLFCLAARTREGEAPLAVIHLASSIIRPGDC